MSDINNLLREASSKPDGSAKTAILREAVRLAETNGTPEERYRAFGSLISAATFSGEANLLLITMPKLLRLVDEHPGNWAMSSVLWKLKWCVTKVVNYPDVPLERVQALENDYASRLQAHDGTTRTADYLRFENRMETGQIEEGIKAYEIWKNLPRDNNSDCRACEVHMEIWYHLVQGDDKGALKTVDPLINGRMSCATKPHETIATALLSSLKENGIEEASALQLRGYPMLRSNPNYLDSVGRHIQFLTAIEKCDEALTIWQRHLNWLEVNTNPSDSLIFHAGAAALFTKLKNQKSTPLNLRLPPNHRESFGKNPVPVEALLRVVEQERDTRAAAFDARNGNTFVSDRIARELDEATVRQW